MTKNQIVRAIAFSLVVILMILVLCDFFKLGNDHNFDKYFYTFRTLPKNTVDTVFIGTSGIDRYWIPAMAYEEYGMVSYPLASDAMPAWLVTDVIEEAQDHHDPKLFVIDIRCFTQDNDAAVMDVRARRVLDAVGFFSIRRLKIAMKTMKIIHEVDETKPKFDFSYILPLIKYHGSWESEGLGILGNPGNRKHKYGGFYVSRKRSLKQVPQTPTPYNHEFYMELDPISERTLYEFFDYIREHDLQVLFLDTPQFKDEHEIGRANAIYQILEEEGFDYVHYYSENPEGKFAIDLDPETDFYNAGHVNYYGATKVTKALAEYINENYDLPDRRGEERYSKIWDGVYDRIITTAEGYKEYFLQQEAAQAAKEAAEAAEAAAAAAVAEMPAN